jgi:hypothetical protein
MPLSLSMVPMFKGGNLQVPVTLDKCFEIEGKKFVSLSKGDRKVERLLLAESDAPRLKNQRTLANTDIIEQLRQLREDMYVTVGSSLLPEKPIIDLGMNGEATQESAVAINKKINKMKILIPNVVLISTPAIGHVAGASMNVILECHAKAPLVVELTTANIDYLVQVVAFQILNGTIRHCHPRVNELLITGLSRVLSGHHEGKYRLVYAGEGGKRCRAMYAADSIDAAIFAAKKIMSSHEQGAAVAGAAVEVLQEDDAVYEEEDD